MSHAAINAFLLSILTLIAQLSSSSRCCMSISQHPVVHCAIYKERDRLLCFLFARSSTSRSCSVWTTAVFFARLISRFDVMVSTNTLNNQCRYSLCCFSISRYSIQYAFKLRNDLLRATAVLPDGPAKTRDRQRDRYESSLEAGFSAGSVGTFLLERLKILSMRCNLSAIRSKGVGRRRRGMA